MCNSLFHSSNESTGRSITTLGVGRGYTKLWILFAAVTHRKQESRSAGVFCFISEREIDDIVFCVSRQLYNDVLTSLEDGD